MSPHPPTPQTEPLDAHERELAERLARLSPHDGPPPALDAKVLAAAHAAAGRPARPAKRRWPATLGIAATLALAIGLAWQLRPLPTEIPARDERVRAAVEPATAEDAVADSAAATQAPAEPPPAAQPLPQPVAPTRTAEPAIEPAPPPATKSAPESVDTAAAPASAHEAAPAASPQAFPSPEAATGVPPAPPPPAPPAPIDTPSPPPPAAMSRAAPRKIPSDAGAAAEATTRAIKSTRTDAIAPAAPTTRHRDSAPTAPAEHMAIASPPAPTVITVTDLPVASDSRLPPSAWLERIRQRRDAGDLQQARESLRRFRLAHPQVALPDDLRTLVPSSP